MKQLMKQRYQEMHGEKGDGGFTLIELLVVIVILAILAAVVIFAVGGISNKGQKASCQSDTQTLRTAEEAQFANTTTGAQYISEANLVSGKYLAQASTLHDITGVPGASYTITIADAACGTVGNSVGQTANDF